MRRTKNKKRVEKKSVKSKIKALAPLKELENALNILNSSDVKMERNVCKTTLRKTSDIVHLSSLHYCSLLKEAVLKQRWGHVMKLLLAYLEEPKPSKYTNGLLFRFTLIHIFNDPIAKALNILDEFLQLALSCQTEDEKNEFMKLLISLRKKNYANIDKDP